MVGREGPTHGAEVAEVGLVVDHHQLAICVCEQQVDHTLNDLVPSDRPDVRLLLMGARRGLTGDRGFEARARQGNDHVLLLNHPFRQCLCTGSSIKTLAGGQIDRLQSRVHGSADCRAVPSLLPRRLFEVAGVLVQPCGQVQPQARGGRSVPVCDVSR